MKSWMQDATSKDIEGYRVVKGTRDALGDLNTAIQTYTTTRVAV